MSTKENEMWYQGKRDIYIDELMLITILFFCVCVCMHVQLCTHTYARTYTMCILYTKMLFVKSWVQINDTVKFTRCNQIVCVCMRCMCTVPIQFNFSNIFFSFFPFSDLYSMHLLHWYKIISTKSLH